MGWTHSLSTHELELFPPPRCPARSLTITPGLRALLWKVEGRRHGHTPRPVALRLALPPASPAARRQELQPPSSPRPPYSEPGDRHRIRKCPSQGGRPAPSSRAALLGAGSAPGPAPSTFWSGRLGGSSACALRAQVEGWPGRQGQPAGLGGAGPLTWPFPAWVPAAPPSCPGEGLKSWPTRNTPPRSFFCPQE